LILVSASDGNPSDPDSFLFRVTGVIKEVSNSWVAIEGGPSYCCVKLDRPGARFDYLEFRDPKIPITDQDRIDAERLFEGALSIDYDDELFYVFNVMRVDLTIGPDSEDPDEETEEDSDLDEE
jgi:hypothetical protein